MLTHKTPAHTFWKNGIFYFRRRVPSDLSHHYTSRLIAYSLRTRSSSVASARATRAAQQLDEYWYHLRIKDSELPGKHLLRLQQGATLANPAAGISTAPEGASVKLSEAVSIYLRLKGQNRPVTFHRAAERSCGYVIDVCGDKDLLAYTKADATSFRDALIERGLAGSSMTRIFGTVRSVVNFAASEVGLDMTNPFAGVYYDRQSGVKERSPLPEGALSPQNIWRLTSVLDGSEWSIAERLRCSLRQVKQARKVRRLLENSDTSLPESWPDALETAVELAPEKAGFELVRAYNQL